ncbi:unnamed protein product [Somion occarium]|uniref:Uncharacterized protein n=1 Tax=Somion occarium TaxID=3059160 RepID=A0ABP1DIP5_9APHY
MPPSFSKTVLAVLTTVIVYGTIHSVLNDTYLDTSNPLLTHLPHPLHATHYFANKKNILNIYFIKQVWAWTTAAFFFLFATSPRTTRTYHRVAQYFVETGVWLVFTSWFFGPSLLDRFVTSTGGECVLVLPSGGILGVPHEFCYTQSTLSPTTHPALFGAPFTLPDPTWFGRPRLRKGHDVSGHMFLLTMSLLFLADQLRYSFARIRSPSGKEESVQWSRLHRYAVFTNIVVLSVLLFSVYTTSVYFHTPFEKMTGFCEYPRLLLCGFIFIYPVQCLG